VKKPGVNPVPSRRIPGHHTDAEMSMVSAEFLGCSGRAEGRAGRPAEPSAHTQDRSWRALHPLIKCAPMKAILDVGVVCVIVL
jgi:hypothetical protein